MGFDLSAGSSPSRSRLPEALLSAQAPRAIEPKIRVDEKARERERDEKTVPAPALTPFEIQVVRERFEPLAPVLKSALRDLSGIERELKTLRQSLPSQPEGSVPLDRPETVRPEPKARTPEASSPRAEPIPIISREGVFLPRVPTPPQEEGPASAARSASSASIPAQAPFSRLEVAPERRIEKSEPASSQGEPARRLESETGPRRDEQVERTEKGNPSASPATVGSIVPGEEKGIPGKGPAGAERPVPEGLLRGPAALPGTKDDKNPPREDLRPQRLEPRTEPAGERLDRVGRGEEKIQREPATEPKPPQGIPVSGGLPVILPGQSQPSPSPESLFSEEDGRRERVGSQGGGVARVGTVRDEIQEFQRQLREKEPGHLFLLSQEALRLLERGTFPVDQQGFAAQTTEFQAEISPALPEIGQGENVAKTPLGGDNVREFPASQEENPGPGIRDEDGEEGTVGAPQQEPPLSNLNRFEPPLPTNIRSRFVPVATVNLLDLVL